MERERGKTEVFLPAEEILRTLFTGQPLGSEGKDVIGDTSVGCDSVRLPGIHSNFATCLGLHGSHDCSSPLRGSVFGRVGLIGCQTSQERLHQTLNPCS